MAAKHVGKLVGYLETLDRISRQSGKKREVDIAARVRASGGGGPVEVDRGGLEWLQQLEQPSKLQGAEGVFIHVTDGSAHRWRLEGREGERRS